MKATFHLIDPAADDMVARSEWDRMWCILKEHVGPENFDNPTRLSGCEIWQYLGTEQVGESWHLDKLMVVGQGEQKTEFVHTFRHRSHPTTGLRTYFYVYATTDYVHERLGGQPNNETSNKRHR